MLGRELLERAGDLPAEHRSLDREPFGVLLVARLVQRQRGAHGGAPARVDDRVPRDLVEPRPHAAARRVVGLGVPPGTREDLLHDLLGGPPVAERVEREAVQLTRVGAIERAQRLAGGVRRDAGEELGVRRHQPLGNTRRSASRFDPRSRIALVARAAGTRLRADVRTSASRPGYSTPSANAVGVVDDARAHAAAERSPSRARPPRRSGGRRRSARRRARAARRAPTGAGPRAGPGRRTARRASPRTRPAAPPPRRRRRRRSARGCEDAPGSAGSRPRTSAQARLERRAERALVVAVDDHQPAARPRTWSQAPTGGQRGGAEVAQGSASKIRLAPGRSPGESAS